MSTQDFDKMSKQELEALAMQWANGEEPTPARDENGRFAKAEEPAAETPVVEAEEEILYQRTIDLGDGAGVQVFEAPTMEELVDKLAKAQEHATRKIRELSAEKKAQPKPLPNPTEAELTPEQKFMLEQEMAKDPVKVINRFVSETIDRREREQAEATARETSESNAFVANTPEYFVSQKNGERMVKYLHTYNLEATEDNLKTAFEDLNSSGLLETRPAETSSETPVATEEGSQSPARIEQKADVPAVVRRRVVGGISVKRSAPTVTTPGLTEKQLRELPLHELEEMTRRALMQN